MVTSKQATKEDGCNQTSEWPQKPTSNKPLKGKQTRTWQRPRSKQTSMDLNQKAWKRANKVQICIDELIQTLY